MMKTFLIFVLSFILGLGLSPPKAWPCAPTDEDWCFDFSADPYKQGNMDPLQGFWQYRNPYDFPAAQRWVFTRWQEVTGERVSPSREDALVFWKDPAWHFCVIYDEDNKVTGFNLLSERAKNAAGDDPFLANNWFQAKLEQLRSLEEAGDIQRMVEFPRCEPESEVPADFGPHEPEQ